MTEDLHVYASRRRQAFFAIGVVVTFCICASLVFEPDPSTGVLTKPSDYLWTLIPSAFLAAFLTWRAWRTRVETTTSAVIIHHVLSNETIQWAEIARFEIHPTPTRRGSNVFARTTLGRLIRVRTFVPARPSTDHRAAAAAFVEWLETDRRQRAAAPAPVA